MEASHFSGYARADDKKEHFVDSVSLLIVCGSKLYASVSGSSIAPILIAYELQTSDQ